MYKPHLTNIECHINLGEKWIFESHFDNKKGVKITIISTTQEHLKQQLIKREDQWIIKWVPLTLRLTCSTVCISLSTLTAQWDNLSKISFIKLYENSPTNKSDGIY